MDVVEKVAEEKLGWEDHPGEGDAVAQILDLKNFRSSTEELLNSLHEMDSGKVDRAGGALFLLVALLLEDVAVDMS